MKDKRITMRDKLFEEINKYRQNESWNFVVLFSDYKFNNKSNIDNCIVLCLSDTCKSIIKKYYNSNLMLKTSDKDIIKHITHIMPINSIDDIHNIDEIVKNNPSKLTAINLTEEDRKNNGIMFCERFK